MLNITTKSNVSIYTTFEFYLLLMVYMWPQLQLNDLCVKYIVEILLLYGNNIK